MHIIKKLITTLFLFCVSLSYAQYTHTFEGYTRDDADEIQFSFIPLSVSNDQEVNQFELGWRRGAHAALFRYGIDNDRTNYYDITSNVYFWLTKHIDLTFGAGFGTRTNVKFEKENVSLKPKRIDEIVKEERAIKITAPHRFEELDIKTLLRNERGVIPPDFYNKRKTK